MRVKELYILFPNLKQIFIAITIGYIVSLMVIAVIGITSTLIAIIVGFLFFVFYHNKPQILFFIFLSLFSYHLIWQGNVFGVSMNYEVYPNAINTIGKMVGFFSLLSAIMQGKISKFRFIKIDLLLAIYLIYISFNSIIADNSSLAFGLLSRHINYIMLYFLTRILITTENEFRQYLTAILAISFFILLVIVSNYFAGQLSEGRPHYLVSFLPILLAISFYLKKTGSRINKSYLNVFIFVAVLFPLFSFSRRIFITVIGYLIGYVNRIKLNPFALIGLISLAILSVFLIPERMEYRLERTYKEVSYLTKKGEFSEGASSGLFSSRDLIWKAGFQMFRDNWVWGVGLNNSMDSFSKYGFYRHLRMHNLFLRILAELGIVGFIIFGMILLKLYNYLKVSIKQNKVNGNNYLLAFSYAYRDVFILSLITSFFGGWYIYEEYAWFSFALYTSLYAISLKK